MGVSVRTWALCYADDLDTLCSGLEIILDDQSCEVRIQKGAVLAYKFSRPVS
jgi:hypothetical protein